MKKIKNSNITISIKDNQIGFKQGSKVTWVKGAWSLDAQHRLVMRASERVSSSIPQRIVLDATLIDFKKNQVVFALTQRVNNSREKTTLVKLGGSWQVDKYNRLRFVLSKDNNTYGTLKFQLAWDLNENQEIVYRWQKRDLARGLDVQHQLTLKGRWRVGSSRYGHYRLQGGGEDTLVLRAGVGSKILYAAKGKIRYQFGIGFKKSQRVDRVVSIFGKWRFGRNLKVGFEAAKEVVSFKLSYLWLKKNKVQLQLKDVDGHNLDYTLELSRKMFKNGDVFVEGKKTSVDKALKLGVKFLL